MLVGRERECDLVEALLDRARGGRSGALVVRGEAGIGKSALLQHAADVAEGLTVVRALGVESEAELEFSGLLDVARPLLERLPHLPEQHAATLRGALGLAPPAQVDRFAVGAASLGLLAEAAPLLVLVDDAQWIDESSADALSFAARRLEADGVAILFAVREGEARQFDGLGLRELELGPIPREAARELLAFRAPVAVDDAVADRLYEATRGNPLALIELTPLLSPEQLEGREPLGDPLPPGGALDRAYANRVATLPEHARSALVVLAAAVSRDLEHVTRALDELSIDRTWLEPSEDAGLIRIGNGDVAFGHPLIRSAVYHGAPPSERRAAHRALAGVLDRPRRDEERAWHLAAAALGPDEEAAAALADAAHRARERSGYAASAAALERAARLTPDAATRRERLGEAAEAAWLAAHRKTALSLVEEALDGVSNPVQRARLLHLRGQIEHLAGEVGAATEILLEAAGLAEEYDRDAAVAMLADAVDSCVSGGSAAVGLAAGERARKLAPRDGGEADFLADWALGDALAINGRSGEGEPHLDRALALLAANDELPRAPRNLIRGAYAAGWLERAGVGVELAARAVTLAREQGAVAVLVHALEVSAWLGGRWSRWDEAYAAASEAVPLARESGETTLVVHALGHMATIDAARGREDRCREHADEAVALGEAVGIAGRAQWALALLDLSLGRLDDAAERFEATWPAIVTRGYFEHAANLVEIRCRLGRLDEAREVYDRHLSLDDLALSPFGAALAGRCRGLLAPEGGFERPFREALELHEAANDRFALARTRLCLGERLRRSGRRLDARRELREALAVFDELGAAPWAARARAELRASGERLRRRQPSAGEELTPQELQIALQVSQGKTNKQVAATLYLSPKTVDFHLRRIYRKLDINSRSALIHRFASSQ